MNDTHHLIELAESGDAKAQFEVAILYARGEEVPKDQQEAINWIKRSAEGGYAVAQNELGVAYATGSLGLPLDYIEAFKWYELAARQEFSQAQHSLGFMYKEGQGVPQDYKETIKWYKLAADHGHPASQYGLGNMYRYGQGVTPNEEEATKWYRRAAEQGHRYAKDALVNDIKLDLEYRYGHFWHTWNESDMSSDGRGHIIQIHWLDGPTEADIQRELSARDIVADLSRSQSLRSKKKFGGTGSGFETWRSSALPIATEDDLRETFR